MAKSPKLSLPKSWSTHVKSAMLHVISMAQYATAYTRGWAADSANARVRLKARVEQLEQELACLREEVRIKDARMSSISAGQQLSRRVMTVANDEPFSVLIDVA